MPFQSSMPEISVAEAQALARFVHDMEARMNLVADLLRSRGTGHAAALACSIVEDLRLLEEELDSAESGGERAVSA